MAFFKQADDSLKIVLRPAESLIIEEQDNQTLFVFNESEIQALPKDKVARIQILAHEDLHYTPSPHRAYLAELFEQMGIEQGVCVDIGAFDGLHHSHTLELYRAGWKGLSIEGQPDRFARLAEAYRHLPQATLSRHWVTPNSIVHLLQAERIPQSFDFLSIDIDSYDHEVLAALLKQYRPSVICAEINEVFPPPLRFSVKYSADFELDLNSRFFGQSLMMLGDLAQAHNYVAIRVHYQDVFLIDANLITGDLPTLEQLYNEGVRQMPHPSYYSHYPFNVENLLNADPETAYKLVREGWPDQTRYYLSLTGPDKRPDQAIT